uniref:Rac GTPase-activating protein 1 n=3 Tax=Petromyzon marinus TaxID=7757 RepID=A0AAJ7SYK9_PETMA|nr:rac GTPase-activating protein 1-like isoform X1 [Petromyzon marinus]
MTPVASPAAMANRMTVSSLLSLFDQIVSQMELLSCGMEPEFIQLARSFQEFQVRSQNMGRALAAREEQLSQAEAEQKALEVKLKHARNQVDVELRRRHKVEAECEKLQSQMQLVREVLMQDLSESRLFLNEEQRTALGFLSGCGPTPTTRKSHGRMSAIRESVLSTSMISEISYDHTDDDWDADTTQRVEQRATRREKRRSLGVGHPEVWTMQPKRSCVPGEMPTAKAFSDKIIYQGEETDLNLTGLMLDTDRIQADPTQLSLSVEMLSRRRTSRGRRLSALIEQSTMENCGGETLQGTVSMLSTELERQHSFVPKTVIKPESCVPCGNRIKFGKLAHKCRDCRMVAHAECREHCPLPCVPRPLASASAHPREGTVADFSPPTAPMIPSLVLHCVDEIERRGMMEVGLYRIPGSDRDVKELKERWLRGKGLPALARVDNVHVVCGLLKDFLRSLKEPLLTHRLHHTFLKAIEISDEDNRAAAMYGAIGQLPQPNRDTLAYLMLHLQRVAESTECKMNQSNLSRVFGPTLVGHATANPEPVVILRDTQQQPMVVDHLMSLPAEFWQRWVTFTTFVDKENNDRSTAAVISNAYASVCTPPLKSRFGGNLLGPLEIPETSKISPQTNRMHLSKIPINTMNSGKNRPMPLGRKIGNYWSSPSLT